MKIKSIDILVSANNEKENKEGIKYNSISLVSLDGSGSAFNVITKDENIKKLTPLKKYNVDLELNNSSYGLKLSINKINTDLGSI